MLHILKSSSLSSSKRPSIIEIDINVAYGMVRAPATQSQSNTDMVDNFALAASQEMNRLTSRLNHMTSVFCSDDSIGRFRNSLCCHTCV